MTAHGPVEVLDGSELLDTGWRRHPQVALRREAFGGVAYHYGTRRLSVLRSPRLADVVACLGDHPSARAACSAAGVRDAELPAFARALGALAGTGMIQALTGRSARTSASASASGPALTPDPAPGPAPARSPGPPPATLGQQFESGLAAPICLTWEVTYACNLACRHCLSSSGRRDPAELSTAECFAVVDELERLGVFYVNIGGGEPTIRADFFDVVEYATSRRLGVKFSTNGMRLTAAMARRLAASDYVDVQVSLDGATPAVNDAVRGRGAFRGALRALALLAEAGCRSVKVSVVVTRHNVAELDALEALADRHGAQLRLTRLRPSGRGADVWDELHPTAEHQRVLYDWLATRGDRVLTGDSFFHLSAFGPPLPGLDLCGAGRVVCLIDPVGDVYACPFTIHDDFRAGNVREVGGFARIWSESPLFARLRTPARGGACGSCGAWGTCRGGCMAAKFFTGMPIDGPDPECVKGHGAGHAGSPVALGRRPRPGADHSRRRQAVVARG